MSRRDRRDGPVRIGRLMNEALAACGLDGRLAERTLLAAWPQIVGERLAAHVRAVDLREGQLLLAADHGAWRQEVSLLSPRIMQECNARFGEGAVTQIRWARAWTAAAPADNDN